MEEGDQTLSPVDVANVLEEMLPAQNQSYLLGLKLKLPLHVVESIFATHSQPRDRLLQVLIAFMQQLEPRPTWSAIVDALRSPAINLLQLAKLIHGKHCPTLPAELVQELTHPRVPSAIIPYRIMSVDEIRGKIALFEDHFKTLKWRTRQGLERRGSSTSVRVVVERLTDLRADDQPDHAVFLKDNLQIMFRACDHHELFGTLNLYWDYLSYHLLDHLIREFSIKEVRGEMEEYKNDLSRFRGATLLSRFAETQTRRRIRPTREFKELAIDFDWPKDATLETVEDFRREYAFHYKLRDCAMMLIQLQIASVHITWFIPESVIDSLKTNIPVSLFEKFSVISLHVADTPVFVNAKHQHVHLADYFYKTPELRPFVLFNVRLTGNGIGAGSYGSVEEVVVNGAICAAKQIHGIFQNQSKIPNTDIHSVPSQFVKECQLMSTLRHPNIVQFLGVCFFQGSQLPALVMERMLTSLHNLLDPKMDPLPSQNETKPFFPLGLKCSILHNVASGLAYLHEQSPPIIHRDLSAQNILINSGLVAKIADLGMARIFPRMRAAATMTKAPGATIYMPPEALETKSEDLRKAKYGVSIDAFSFGVVSIFALTQTFPCNLLAATYRDEQKKIMGRSELERRDEYMQKIYSQLRKNHPLLQIIEKCLDFPEDRPSICEVLRLLELVKAEERDEQIEMSKLELIQLLKKQQDENQPKMQRLNQELQSQMKKSAELQQQLQSSRQQLTMKEAELTRAEQMIRREQQQIHKMEQSVKKEIGDLERQLRSSETLVVDLKKTVQQRDSELKTLKTKTLSTVPPTSSRKLSTNQQLTVQCHEKKTAPRGMDRGSATTDCRFAYILPNGSKSVYKYEWSTEKWEKLLPCPYRHSALVIIDGALTTVGGYDGSRFTNKLFTLQQSEWVTEYPPMNTARSRTAVVRTSNDSYFIVIGGGGGDWSTTVELFQVRSRRWYELANLPQPLSSPSATLCGNQLHVIGYDGDGYSCSLQGLLSNDQPTMSLSMPHSVTWTLLPRLPVQASTAAVLSGQLVIIGGMKSWSPVNSIHQLVNGLWAEIGTMTSERCLCIVVSSSPDNIMIVGGFGFLYSIEECVLV